MVRALLAAGVVLLAACSAPAPPAVEKDVADDALPSPDAAPDAMEEAAVPDRAAMDVAPDRVVTADVAADRPVSMDATAPRCDGRFTFNPSAPGDDAAFEVAVTDAPGYVYVGMQVVGPGAPVATWVGVAGSSPYTWRWRVTGHVAGAYYFRFTADMGTREVATCVRDVVARGGVRDAGIDGTVTPDASSSAPPANRFGIGLVGPGSADDFERAANLAGPGGHVKLIFAGVRPGMTGPTAEWAAAVREAYARDLVPVIRFSPDWGDRRVRNQSDDGAGARFTRLAAAYAAVVRGLPLRAGWPLYVETHNEPNLCYEWQCDPGAFGDNRITLARIAAEYGALVRDVAAALHAIGDARVRVANGGLAPGGVRWCQCVGARDVGAGEWEGGSTSLDFIAAMRSAVPSAVSSLDAWASHAYPASGRGYGFFPPYASAGVGLRYFRDELAAAGRALPVLVTETGWSVRRDGGGANTRDEVATWTVQAYGDVWLADPEVRAVMPFMLRDAAWEDFAWVSASGSEYPVYRAVRALRCGRVAGRCP